MDREAIKGLGSTGSLLVRVKEGGQVWLPGTHKKDPTDSTLCPAQLQRVLNSFRNSYERLLRAWRGDEQIQR